MDGNVGEEGSKFSSIMPRRITCLYLPYPNLSNVVACRSQDCHSYLAQTQLDSREVVRCISAP